MLKTAFFVGCGGFIGTVLRYLVTVAFLERVSSGFPYGTLSVNVLGCFMIGVLLAYAHTPELTFNWRFFLSTGICGGFTTFSAFSAETFSLVQSGQPGLAVAYAGLSVLLGLAATACGFLIFR